MKTLGLSLAWRPVTATYTRQGLSFDISGIQILVSVFGFISDPRVSTFSLSPPSILEDGSKWFMGLTWSSPLETHLIVACFLHSNSVILVIWILSPFLVLWLLLCVRLSLIKHLFCAEITFSRPFLFRAPSY